MANFKLFGFITINKPTGVTSRKAIDSVKKLVRPSKVGHTGTLDPLATGVLVVAIGPATRLTRYVQNMRKTYTAEFQFGVTSDSDDIETELRAVVGTTEVSRADLELAMTKFIGQIQQTPPAYSAVKIDGRRAYKLAREGAEVKIQPKSVEVHSVEIISYSYPHCKLKICCGSGTYIRSLGRDLGISLNSGAVMTSLVRDSVGVFSLENAVEIEELEIGKVRRELVAPAEIFDAETKLVFSESQKNDLAVGKLFDAAELGVKSNLDAFVCVDNNDRLLAVFELHSSGKYRPALNFVQYYDQLQSQ